MAHFETMFCRQRKRLGARLMLLICVVTRFLVTRFLVTRFCGFIRLWKKRRLVAQESAGVVDEEFGIGTVDKLTDLELENCEQQALHKHAFGRCTVCNIGVCCCNLRHLYRLHLFLLHLYLLHFLWFYFFCSCSAIARTYVRISEFMRSSIGIKSGSLLYRENYRCNYGFFIFVCLFFFRLYTSCLLYRF